MEKKPFLPIRSPAGWLGLLLLMSCTDPFWHIQATQQQAPQSSDGGIVSSADPCDSTRVQALAILKADCAGCHEAPASTGNFNFVLDVNTLITTNSSTGAKFVAPGDPADSRIYQRIAAGEMPPPGVSPRPSTSDISLLSNWITNCTLPSTGGVGGPGGGTATGGVTGSGGVSGLGGTPGTGGEMGAGGETDRGGEGSAGGTTGVGGDTGGALDAGRAIAGETDTGGTVGAGGTMGSGGTMGAGGSSSTGGVASTGGARGTGGATAVADAGLPDGRVAGGPAPCAGLCQNPLRFSVPPTYDNAMLGTAAACLETIVTPVGWVCGNMTGRTFSINGVPVNCANLAAPSATRQRNGGYCFQATAGGLAYAYFSAY